MTGSGTRCIGDKFDTLYEIEDDFDIRISTSLQRGDMTIRDIARMGFVFWSNRRVLMPREHQSTGTTGDNAVRILREKLRCTELSHQKAIALERDRLAQQMQCDKDEIRRLRDEMLAISDTHRAESHEAKERYVFQLDFLQRQVDRLSRDSVTQNYQSRIQVLEGVVAQKNDEIAAILSTNSGKRMHGENVVSECMRRVFPDKEITSTAGYPHECDIHLTLDVNEVIVFEVKNKQSGVTTEDVTKFVQHAGNMDATVVLGCVFLSLCSRNIPGHGWCDVQRQGCNGVYTMYVGLDSLNQVDAVLPNVVHILIKLGRIQRGSRHDHQQQQHVAKFNDMLVSLRDRSGMTQVNISKCFRALKEVSTCNRVLNQTIKTTLCGSASACSRRVSSGGAAGSTPHHEPQKDHPTEEGP